ncbi:unnamed protein product [Rhodiola kirilowii]
MRMTRKSCMRFDANHIISAWSTDQCDLEVVATVMAKMTILFELDLEMVMGVIREQDESPRSYVW